LEGGVPAHLYATNFWELSFPDVGWRGPVPRSSLTLVGGAVRKAAARGIYPKRESPDTKERQSMSEGSGVAQTREQSGRTLFDRFADWCADFVSGAPFFALCVLLVVLWAPAYFLVGNLDAYQLVINTPTTLITFLLVAPLQNTQKRTEEALQHKLDALADGLADLMDHFAERDPERQAAKEDLAGDIEDLRAAVGLEVRCEVKTTNRLRLDSQNAVRPKFREFIFSTHSGE
jgi:hypothetical protein